MTSSRRRVGLLVGTMLLASTVGLAGCGSAPSSAAFSTADQAQVAAMMATAHKGSAQTVSATYSYTTPSSTRTLTFAQSPPSSRVDFGNGTFAIYTGSVFTECTHAKCHVLRGSASPRAQLADVYNGQTFIVTMQNVVLSATQRAAFGLTVHFSRATYDGRTSRCVMLKITKQKPGTITLCETASGIMDHEAAGTSSATLVSLTKKAPASDFVAPRSATSR